MSVSIRLRREGARNRPYYKVVVADSRSPRDGKFLEIIGTYDPKLRGANTTIKLERAEHWIARGAQPSDTVRSLMKKTRAWAAGAPVEVDEPAPAKAKKPDPAQPDPVQPAPVAEAPAAEVPAEAPAAEPAVEETPAAEPAPIEPAAE